MNFRKKLDANADKRIFAALRAKLKITKREFLYEKQMIATNKIKLNNWKGKCANKK